MDIKILIGGDVVPTKSNLDFFTIGDRNELLGDELCDVMDSADFTILNLEAPITDEENPIIKCGPNLRIPTRAMKGLKAINPCFYSLANNHIMDNGIIGLNSTMKLLNKWNIEYAGAGKNLQEASKVFVKIIKGKKIGILCCAEHEFSIAGEICAGANPFDNINSFESVANTKKECDLVIVLYHGGKEHYRYPSPVMQKVFRKFADVGADLVIAQHTHCIGCEEKYNNSILVQRCLNISD